MTLMINIITLVQKLRSKKSDFSQKISNVDKYMDIAYENFNDSQCIAMLQYIKLRRSIIRMRHDYYKKEETIDLLDIAKKKALQQKQGDEPAKQDDIEKKVQNADKRRQDDIRELKRRQQVKHRKPGTETKEKQMNTNLQKKKIFPEMTDKLKRPYQQSRAEKLIFCRICKQWVPKRYQVKVTRCPHHFCKQCLLFYIRYRILIYQPIFCPQPACLNRIQIREQQNYYLKFLSSEQKKRLNDICDAYDQQKYDPEMLFCPKRNCKGQIFLDQKNPSKTVSCQKCKMQFCRCCLLPAHETQCEQQEKKFIQKNFTVQKCKRCFGTIFGKRDNTKIICPTCDEESTRMKQQNKVEKHEEKKRKDVSCFGQIFHRISKKGQRN